MPGRVTTNVTITGRIAEPLAHLAALGGAPPGISEAAGEAASEAVGALVDEFVPVASRGGWFPSPCRGRPEPLNHAAAFGAALIRLHDLDGSQRWLQRAHDVAEWWRGATFRDRSGSLVWRYDPTPRRRRGRTPELVWKAAVTVHFLALAADREIGIGAEDLDEVRATLMRNVFRDGAVAATIGADRERIEVFGGARGGAAALMPLVELGGEVRGAVEGMVASDPGLGGWLAHPHGLVGYAHRLGD